MIQAFKDPARRPAAVFMAAVVASCLSIGWGLIWNSLKAKADDDSRPVAHISRAP